MSEKKLLEAFKSIILFFLTFTFFGPPIISKIGNVNINDYFFKLNAFMSPPNIEAESLQESKRIQIKKVYVPSIKIINKLMHMDNTKIYLNSPSEKSKENNDKENSIAVRDRKKDFPKRVDEGEIPPPSGFLIKETTPTVRGGTITGGGKGTITGGGKGTITGVGK